MSMSELLPCVYRGDEIGPGRFGCSCPKLLIGAAGVDAGICNQCPYRTEEPGLFQKAANLAGAIVRHVGHGLTVVSDDEFSRRMSLCTVCDQRRDDTCLLCGCNLPIKVRWASQECPAGKWPGVSSPGEATPTRTDEK